MKFKVHPAIGIARLGDSPTSFYLAPEHPGDLPTDCDADGNPVRPGTGNAPPIKFKDAEGRVRRQAARFQVFVYDEDGSGVELVVGSTYPFVDHKSGVTETGEVLDIEWTVYLANKKACWYEFSELAGDHGYASTHPLRNSSITDPEQRNCLIIDPGPQTVMATDAERATAHFAVDKNPGYTQTFPPPLQPRSIDSLGEIRAIQQGGRGRLLVLGGFGNSGSMLTGFGQPMITDYANNDGWFDDTSDGPVLARIQYQVLAEDGRVPSKGAGQIRFANVDVGAWVIVGYPRYAPQVTDMITMDDIVYDVAVRNFGQDTTLFGLAPFDRRNPPPDPKEPKELATWRRLARWNPDYYPRFESEIWPLLQRPFGYQWVMDADPTTGGDPHDTTPGIGGNFDPDLLGKPPSAGEPESRRAQRLEARMFLWNALRKAGQENVALDVGEIGGAYNSTWLMPLLCGDNPISNTTPSKFLRLTDTQLFLLGQWASGKFVNESDEQFAATATGDGQRLDRGVLGNLLGGSFCPGAETGWIIRNPAIFADSYRINLHPRFALDPLSSTPGAPLGSNIQPLSATGDLNAGLEPGDLTKYSALPWQSDFNECTSQAIDITYEDWNQLYLGSTNDPAVPLTHDTFWWPAHRPMYVGGKEWGRGIPHGANSNHGDLKMVTAWKDLGFVLITDEAIEVERNEGNL